MSKYSRELKLQVAKLASESSSYIIGELFNVSSRQVRYWSAVYQIHGINSFLHKERPYSQAFKLTVLAKMKVKGWSLTYTSAYFDLSSPGILFQWNKLYDDGGLTLLTPRKKGRPRMKQHPSQPKPSEQMTEKELREELEYLRAENAVLKKLEALAQQRKKKTKTKR